MEPSSEVKVYVPFITSGSSAYTVADRLPSSKAALKTVHIIFLILIVRLRLNFVYAGIIHKAIIASEKPAIAGLDSFQIKSVLLLCFRDRNNHILRRIRLLEQFS